MKQKKTKNQNTLKIFSFENVIIFFPVSGVIVDIKNKSYSMFMFASAIMSGAGYMYMMLLCCICYPIVVIKSKNLKKIKG